MEPQKLHEFWPYPRPRLLQNPLGPALSSSSLPGISLPFFELEMTGDILRDGSMTTYKAPTCQPVDLPARRLHLPQVFNIDLSLQPLPT